MRWLAIVLAGCASAGTPDQSAVDSNTGGGSDSGNPMIDSSMVMIDAPPGPQTRTLSQTTSQAIKGGNTLACSNNTTGYTRSNNFYRVFDLAALGITTMFNVTKVSFQIEHCHSSTSTGCTVAVRVGTYTGGTGATLDPAMMTLKASNATVAVPEVVEVGTTTPGGTVDAPITAAIPGGSKLYVVIESPDTTFAFYPATNDGGESAMGYIQSSTCSINNPTNMSGALGTAPAAPRHLLLTVTGTY